MRYLFHAIMTVCFIFLLWAGTYLTQRPPLDPPPNLIAEGYGGPIEMKLETSPEGKITDLRVLRHDETNSYVAGLESFIGQFIGRTHASPLILGKDIDAISGATITSKAIAGAVLNSIHPTDLKRPAKEMPVRSLTGMITPLLLILLAILAFASRNNALRWAALLGGFIYLGIISRTMFSIIQIIQTGLRHTPSAHQDPLWWVLMLAGTALTLLIGRVYCGSLCPFALVQEIFYQFIPRKRPPKEEIAPEVDNNARLTKYILLFVVTAVSFLLGSASCANIEPFITLFSTHGSKIAWAFLALMLILAVFNFRFWCKYLCPAGALTSLLAAFSFIKVRLDPAKCTRCGICTPVCPTKAITTNAQGMPVLNDPECIACAKCMHLCPEKALTLKCPGHEKK